MTGPASEVPTYGPFDRPLTPDDPYRSLESSMGIVRVVRVVCEGCGARFLNTRAEGSEGGLPRFVAVCEHCGAETARYYDTTLVEGRMAERYGWEEAP